MAACVLALLVACAGTDDPAPTGAPGESDEPSGPAQTSEVDEVSEEDGGAAEAAPEEPDVLLPACTGLLLEEGGELAGEDVGACLGAVMAAQGPTRKDLETSDSHGTVAFTYAPSFASLAEVEADETVRLYVDETAGWLETPAGWVEANEGGSPEEQMAHAVVSLYRAAADVRAQVDLLSSVPVWDVLGPEEVTRPDGIISQTWRIEAAEPFDYGPVVVDELVLWIDDERRLVQDSVTSGFGDITETAVSRYYDFGADIDLSPPAG